MFKQLARAVKHALRDKIAKTGHRSGRWRKVRRDYIKDHNSCAACGGKKKLAVHHVKPFHLHPDLELDPTNFSTLCMKFGCHIILGHGGDYKAYNPDVREDAQKVLESLDKKQALKDIEPIIDAKKLYL